MDDNPFDPICGNVKAKCLLSTLLAFSCFFPHQGARADRDDRPAMLCLFVARDIFLRKMQQMHSALASLRREGSHSIQLGPSCSPFLALHCVELAVSLDVYTNDQKNKVPAAKHQMPMLF